MLDQGISHDANGAAEAAVETDYDRLGEALDRQGIAIAEVARKVAAFAVAVPSWGVGTGGTRFARFPGGGEPRNVFDKLDDCGVVHQLTGATPTVSLHIPWDAAPAADLLAKAAEGMAGAVFRAERAAWCGFCPARPSCPANPAADADTDGLDPEDVIYQPDRARQGMCQGGLAYAGEIFDQQMPPSQQASHG